MRRDRASSDRAWRVRNLGGHRRRGRVDGHERDPRHPADLSPRRSRENHAHCRHRCNGRRRSCAASRMVRCHRAPRRSADRPGCRGSSHWGWLRLLRPSKSRGRSPGVRALRLRGLQAYSVSGSHGATSAERKHISQSAFQTAAAIRDLLAGEGFRMDILTGGSTGSWDIDLDLPDVTEIQAGSYVMMDLAYRRIGIDFAPAMTILATVVSANHDSFVTVDAGFKAFATDRGYGSGTCHASRRNIDGAAMSSATFTSSTQPRRPRRVHRAALRPHRKSLRPHLRLPRRIGRSNLAGDGA